MELHPLSLALLREFVALNPVIPSVEWLVARMEKRDTMPEPLVREFEMKLGVPTASWLRDPAAEAKLVTFSEATPGAPARHAAAVEEAHPFVRWLRKSPWKTYLDFSKHVTSKNLIGRTLSYQTLSYYVGGTRAVPMDFVLLVEKLSKDSEVGQIGLAAWYVVRDRDTERYWTYGRPIRSHEATDLLKTAVEALRSDPRRQRQA